MDDLVLLRDGSKTMMVKVWEILAIQSEGDYTRTLIADKDGDSRKFLMKRTLSSWECLLPVDLFFKVSRSLVVNTKSITQLVKRESTTWELHLQGIKTPILLSNLESKRLREVL